MERDLGDILDRQSIAKLKAARIGLDENIREYEAFSNRISKQYDFDIEMFFKLILKLNGFIWDLESALKSGKDNLKEPHYLFSNNNDPQLIQIGIISILIRNINSVRIDIKNIVNNLAKEGFTDVKKNHISE